MFLEIEQIEKQLVSRELENFNVIEEDEIYKLNCEFDFADFHEAMEFVNHLAELAEEHNHHPDICIHYNKVMLELWTHSQNGVTEADLDFAEQINNI